MFECVAYILDKIQSPNTCSIYSTLVSLFLLAIFSTIHDHVALIIILMNAAAKLGDMHVLQQRKNNNHKIDI